MINIIFISTGSIDSRLNVVYKQQVHTYFIQTSGINCGIITHTQTHAGTYEECVLLQRVHAVQVTIRVE